jgi:hypothetical protein
MRASLDKIKNDSALERPATNKTESHLIGVLGYTKRRRESNRSCEINHPVGISLRRAKGIGQV